LFSLLEKGRIKMFGDTKSVISEYLKSQMNQGKISDPYFWRDNKGLEVDLVLSDSKDEFVLMLKGIKKS